MRNAEWKYSKKGLARGMRLPGNREEPVEPSYLVPISTASPQPLENLNRARGRDVAAQAAIATGG